MKRFSNPKAGLLGRFLVLLALTCLAGGELFAQTRPNNLGQQQYDVFLGASKVVQLDRFVEDVTSSDSNIVRVEKVPGSETQISLTGISIGKATVTVRSGTGSIVYNVAVSPQPQRIYINVPENRRLTFTGDIEGFTVSLRNIINVRQLDDNILVIEAVSEGRTALNVTSGGEIYRYFVSTFSNRGADRLEIQNAFTQKGYNLLQIQFERDQAIITGTVPTQEELDDAVRIVKQYTPYVEVRAVVGAVGLDYADSEEERVIINNIKRIADLPNLIVKVKFQQPEEIRRSTFTRVVGEPTLRTSVTDNETRLTTETIDLPPADEGAGGLQRRAQEGTIEEISRVEDLSVPEKIFLFGQLENDIEEARAIRVARTFCPLVVSMVTIKDPIQLRMRVRFVDINYSKMKDTGVLWTGSPEGGPLVALDVFGGGDGLPFPTLFSLQELFNSNSNISETTVQRAFNADLRVNATATLQLMEQENWGETLDEMHILMINGQPGQFFSGTEIPFVSEFAVTDEGVVIPSITFINVGLNLTILPLRNRRASQLTGEVQDLVSGDGTRLIQANASFMQLNDEVGDQEKIPFIDESVKYVDENGLIGVECFASVSALDLEAGDDGFIEVGEGFSAPQLIDSSSSARAYLREGQSVVVSGLLTERTGRTLSKVPYLSDLPILGKLFTAQDNSEENSELLVVFSPELVRMADDDKTRAPHPGMPEMTDYLTRQGDVPILKRVRYDAGEVDLRPELDRPPYEEPKNIAPAPVSKNVDASKQIDLPQSEPKDMSKVVTDLDADEKSILRSDSGSVAADAGDSDFTPSFRATDDSSSGTSTTTLRPVSSSTVDTSESEENTSDTGGGDATLP
ncbi:MAG: hypothetical protein AAGK14_06820 [Verrucomicrobiota bacterium]